MRPGIAAVNSFVRPAAVRLALPVAGLLIAGCSASPAHRLSSRETQRAALKLPPHVYRVPSGSMEPTLPIGARVVVGDGRPFVGAIVISHDPEGAEQQLCGPKPHEVRPGGAACDAPVPRMSSTNFVKRIVAGPGDEIYVRSGHVYRKAGGTAKFVRERDPYVAACGASPECDFPIPIKVSSGHWFLMGDQRGESDDSRFWGPVPTAWIVGVVTGLECPRFGRRPAWVRRGWRQGCPRGG